MTRVRWDDPKKRFFEAGVDRGVLFPQGQLPIPWNGLIAVKEAPADSKTSPLYQDGVKYRNGEARGSFAATIDAFTYPEELDELRDNLGVSYRSNIGKNADGAFGYKLHLVYNALVSPIPVNYMTINANPTSSIFSWALSTKVSLFRYQRFSAHLWIDSTKTYPGVMDDFEDLLYGTDSTDGYFPTPQEVLEFFDDHAQVKITDNGDGTWTAEGPDAYVYMIGTGIFEINSPGAVYLDSETYQIESW